MISDRVHRFLIAYDIADDSRRVRVAKALEAHGDRIQYSVFLVDAKPARLLRLRLELRAHMDMTVDSALVCDLGPLRHGGIERLEFLGLERPYTGVDPLIL